MLTLRYALHVAHLDPLTGEGLLTCPRPDDDMPDPFGGPSLHEVAWNAAVRDLGSRGWEPTEGEDGGTCHAGYTEDGSEAVGLYGREPITSTPTIPEQAAALDALGRLADLT